MSATTISWIVTGVFVLILAAGFLIGLWRGFKKSLFCMIGSLVGAVVSFFLTPVITNAIMGIKIEVGGMYLPLNEVFVNMLRKNSDINTMMTNNPNMEAFFERLPYAIGNAIVFILLTIAIELVVYIIYRILASIFLKRKEGESMHRLGGAFLGLGTIFVIVIFAFMPLASLVTTANQVTVSESYATETTAEADEGGATTPGVFNDMLPAQAVEAIRGVNNSLLTKVSSLFGMHNVLFDYYANVEIDGEKVYIRQEVVNYYQALDLLNQVRKNTVEFAKLNYDKIEKLLNNIIDGGLFKSIVPSTAKELILHHEDYSILAGNALITEFQDVIQAIGDDIQDLSKTELYNYFRNDITKIFEAVKTIGKSGAVDQVLKLSDKTLKNVTNILATKSESLKSALRSLFDINMVKDTLGTITEKLVTKANIEYIDHVAVDTKAWASDKWDNLAEDLTQSCQDLSSLLQQVEFDVIYDITKLLDTTQDYNITAILNNVGRLADKVRGNDLLRNAADESIFDTFLEHYDLTLPAGQVENYSTGSKVTLGNYTQLMQFIAPAVEKVKASGIYGILTAEGASADTIITNLAGVISQEGNEDILREVLLPFYQIDVTREKIFDKVSDLNNSLVDFSTLTEYEDWKKDLGYISQILLTLTDENAKVGDKTYLQLIMENNLDAVIDNLTDEQVEDMFKPILYAKSTGGVRTKLFNTIATTINNITGGSYTITPTATTFVEGSDEDQADEIIDVVKQFIVVGRDADNALALGKLLDKMKLNAYRTVLSDKENTGILRGVFDGLYVYITDNYPDISKVKGDKASYELEYEKILSIVDSLTNAEADSFIDQLADMLSSNATDAQLLNLIDEIDAITSTESDDIGTLFENILSLDVDVITENTQNKIDANAATIAAKINGNDNISEETKQLMFAFFGIED